MSQYAKADAGRVLEVHVRRQLPERLPRHLGAGRAPVNVLQRLGLDRETRELNRMTAFQMERDYMAKMSRPHNPPPPPQASNSLPTPPRRA